ncbi:MAG: hypothetical protein IJF49_08505 [Clostridia bacterium]|nr:hypothetical protein [Clostridia bacterium]
MTEEQIEKLTIEIETKVTGSQNLEKYRKEMDKVNAATKRQRDLMEEIELLGRHGNPSSAQAKGFKKDLDKDIARARKEYEKYLRTLNNGDEQQKKAAKSTSKLADAFTRIVRFKIVAAVLQKSINAANEGVEALAEYDDKFRDTITSYQTAFKQIGGGAAVSLAPVLEELEPVVAYLADGVGALGNSVSALMAHLTGETSYRAVKSFSDIKTEMEAADKKAKELRQTISGFDELNIFSKKDNDRYIQIFEDVELGSDEYADDITKMVDFAVAAGVAAGAVKLLNTLFGKKNKTLKEQTKDTKADSEALEELTETANAFVPAADGVLSALAALGGLLIMPKLDPTGVTVPAAEAGNALDVLGQKAPEPVIDTSALIVGAEEAKAIIDEVVTAEYPSIELDADVSPMKTAMEDAKKTISDGMTSMVETFYAKVAEIETKWSTMLSGLSAKWTEFVSGLTGGGVTDVGSTEGGLSGKLKYAKDMVSQAFSGSFVNATGVSVNPGGTVFNPSMYATTSNLLPSGYFNRAQGMTEGEYEQYVKDSTKAAGVIGAGLAIAGGGTAILSGAGAGAAASAGGVSLLKQLLGGLRSVCAYAGGGIVDSGEFFMARENGIPEFVGSFGQRTGVANNDQIVSGIAGGVESALSAYVPQIIRAIEDNAVSVNIGDDQIARSAQRGAARYRSITGQPMFS